MSFSKDSLLTSLIAGAPSQFFGPAGAIGAGLFAKSREDKLKQQADKRRRRAFDAGRAETIGNAPAIERSRLLGSSALSDRSQSY